MSGLLAGLSSKALKVSGELRYYLGMNVLRIILLALLFNGSAHSAPAPQSLVDLAGRPIGTVFGFQYPDLEQALGTGFVREDGPSNLSNLRKLAAGRVPHVSTIKYFYDYQLKQREPIDVHPPLLVKQYLTRCAVSQKGRVSLADVDTALT
ncbi:hypothetical protein ACHMW6_07270 [Pseudoduganella sp. UC29_106]|uniref:hypothetical protein n=1 Tax=Pseudoduganella sp. UC29_106 TaxID=3374553 RepID=UPI0037570A1D